ncbi:fermentation/respiration switch protein [compost metagenome]
MPETFVTFEVDQQTVRGVLHTPETGGPAPAVLWLHGFFGHRMEGRRIFVEGARRLAKRGIASLRIDFRGAGESDGESADSSIATRVADARAAMAFLRAHPAVDGERLAALGFSLGSAIASQLADEPGLQAMVHWSPVVFPVPIFARMGLYAAHPELARQGWIDANGQRAGRQFLSELAPLDPLSALADWDRPLYVLYGAEDMVATSENAEALLSEIPSAQGECLPHGDHAFGTVAASTWLLDRTEAWLGSTLSPMAVSS